MRKMKKWFSGFLCLTLLLGLLPTAAWAAEDAGTLPDETDLAALSESEDVDSASYDDNTVVTRAILAELIYQNETLQGVIGTNTSAFGFSDISGLSQEQQDAINAMANARFISGIGLDTSGDPLFSPSTEVTRADAAVIFWKLTGSKQVPLDTLSFTDVFATDWYAPAVAAMASAGLINGYSDGTFNPVGTATNPSRITVQELNVLIGRCTGTAAGEYTTPADFAELPTAATRLEMLMVAYERYKDSPLATVTAEEIDYADIDACTDEERKAIQFFTSRGVVRGYNPANNSGVNLFGPYDAVSNLQAAMFLYRCAMKFEPDSGTRDGDEILEAQAVSYALGLGEAESTVTAALEYLAAELGHEVEEYINENQDTAVLASSVSTWTEALVPKAPEITIADGQATITAEDDAVIYYTTGDVDPTVESTRYTAPIDVTQGTTVKAVAVKNSLYSEVAAENGETVTVTTSGDFLTAAQNTNVTKIIVANSVIVDTTPDTAATTISKITTDAEIEIAGNCKFSIAADTCLVSTAGVGQFHYETIPAQGNENYDRLAGDGVFFLLKTTEDGGYYRELYGSADAAKAALTSADDWYVAVIPACSMTFSAGETLQLQGLYLGTEAVITLENGAGFVCESIMEPTDGGEPGQLKADGLEQLEVTTLGQLETASSIEGDFEIVVAGSFTVDRFISVPQELSVADEVTLTVENGEYATDIRTLDGVTIPDDYKASPLHKRTDDPDYGGNDGVDNYVVVYRIINDASELQRALGDGEGVYFAENMDIPAGITLSTPVEIGTDVKLTLEGPIYLTAKYHRFGYEHIGRQDQENFDQLAADNIQFLIDIGNEEANDSNRELRPSALYADLGVDNWDTAILSGVVTSLTEFGISNERTVIINQPVRAGVIQVYGNLVLLDGGSLIADYIYVFDGGRVYKASADLTLEGYDGTVIVPDSGDDDDSGSSGSSGGSGSSNTTTERNPDGTTTTTTTNPSTGTVTETTRNPDGSREVVETQTDGTVTTTTTDAAGNRTQVVENADGSSTTSMERTDGTASTTTVTESGQVEASVTLSRDAVETAEADGQAAVLPMPSVPVTSDRSSAAAVTVELPAGITTSKVEIPVEDVTPGTVAVAVLPDGTEQVIRTTQSTENGLILTVEGEATVKIVDNSTDFTDVPGSHWAADAVAFVSARELFNGTSAQTFSPNAPTTRAQLMTVLARLDGADASGSNALQQGIAWAVESGISNGSDPGAAISRQQLVTMLYRYAGSPATEYVLDYPDTAQVSAYATDAMRWAVENGIINGTSSGTLDPYGTATRSQMAAILMRYYALME